MALAMLKPPEAPQTHLDGMVMDECHGLWTRPWTNDVTELHQTFAHYKRMPQLSGKALDLGAHIGASARLMRQRGATQVIAVEADPDNARMAMLNADEHVHVLNVAVNGEGGWAMLSRNTNGHTTTHYTQFSAPKRAPLRVPALSFRALYEWVQPQALKIDIEYGEWDFWEELRSLPYTDVLQIEFHFNHFKAEQELYRERARALGRTWLAQGYECLKGQRVTPSAWYSEQLWVRHGS
jgi:FkbM family methyltransferase